MNSGLGVVALTRYRTPGAGYTNYNTITIASGQVTGTLTSFPMLFSGTLAGLKTVANGGHVTNVNGYDIIFSTTTAFSGSGILPFELLSYSASTGNFIAYVNVPSIATGTVIYIQYGNSTISTSQANSAGTWTSYLGVWHFGTSSSLVLTDSTGNSTATNHGGTAAAGAGALGGALALASASSQWVDTGNQQTGLTNFTLEAWLKNASSAQYFPMSSRNSAGTAGIFMMMQASSQGVTNAIATGYSSGGGYVYVNAASGLSTSVFHYLAGTHAAGVNNSVNTYFDGSASGETPETSGSNANPANSGVNLYFGKDGADSTPYYYNGAMTEVRLSSVVRSAAWISATYNSQSAPASFYAVT